MSSKFSVTIIVPVLNEQEYLKRAITSLVPQDQDDEIDYELLVLDGGSTDRSRQIAHELALANPRIRVMTNEGRLQSAAINKGVKAAMPGSEIIIRADCHSEYPMGFAGKLARELRSRNVASVAVPIRSVGISPVQRAIAAAQNSRLGNGGSLHRLGGRSCYVEHGHHAAFDRKAFLATGGYDETFAQNEDAELDARLAKSGGRIWLCSDLAHTYFPRTSFRSLAKQYFGYGSGRARTAFKHRQQPKIRQMIPLAVLGTNVCSIGLGAIAGWPFLLPAFAYSSTCAVWGGILAVTECDVACLGAGWAAMVMHHCWAAGFVYTSLGLRGVRRRSAVCGEVAPASSTSSPTGGPPVQA